MKTLWERFKQWIPHDVMALQLAAYAIILAAMISYVIGQAGTVAAWRYYTSIALLGILLAINFVWTEIEDSVIEPETLHWAYLVLAGGLVTAAVAIGEVLGFPYLFFMLVAQAFTVKAFLPATLYSGAVLFTIFLALFSIGMPVSEVPGILPSILLGGFFSVTVAVAVRSYILQNEQISQLNEQLQQTNRELLEARQREKALAAAAERVRLAREIHDGLGHYLTALNIQLQAANKVIAKDPSKAESILEVCLRQAQAAMAEVRRSVAVMRRTPLDGKSLGEALAVLVAEFKSASHLTGQFEQHGEEVELSTMASLTLYRAVQEGLTNAQKHAEGATYVLVVLDYTGHEVGIRVENDGQRTHIEAHEEGGFGLHGLRERAEQLGGAFHAAPLSEGGFLLAFNLPKEGVRRDTRIAG